MDKLHGGKGRQVDGWMWRNGWKIGGTFWQRDVRGGEIDRGTDGQMGREWRDR